jgi:hypothetical protein
MIDAPAMFAGLAQGISAMFGGPFVAARVIDQAAVALDDGGSIPDNPADPTFRTCQLQVDSVTDAMRQADGYAEGDVRVLILSATLAGSLDTDATVEVLAGPYTGSWLVSSITRDPAAVYYEGRGRRA